MHIFSVWKQIQHGLEVWERETVVGTEREIEMRRVWKGMREKQTRKERKREGTVLFGQMVTWLFFWFNKQRDVVNNKDTWDIEEKQKSSVRK